MEGLLVLLALAVLAIPVLLIIFMVKTSRLAREVDALKMDVRRLQAGAVGAGTAADSVPTPSPEREAPGKPVPSEPVSPPTPAKAAPGPWQVSTSDKATREDQTEVAAPPAPPELPAPDSPPRAVVFTAERFDALLAWLKINWIYVVSAVSLALAGLFLVEYGIEIGLLTPAVRVLAGLLLGTGFVAGGEYIRRKWGDRSDVATAFLPSVFSEAPGSWCCSDRSLRPCLCRLISPTLALIGLVVYLGTGLGFRLAGRCWPTLLA
ncbi:MAG: DUF2339 domain-containing protein [Paracoccaceae bacterium]